jgi:hypothetical protein
MSIPRRTYEISVYRLLGPDLRIEIRMRLLDEVCSFLADHIDIILDTTIWNERKDGSIADSEVLGAINLEVRVDNAVIDVLAETE